MKRAVFLILLFTFNIISAQQNLVINPSFEEYWSCPPFHTFDSLPCKGWFSPDLGTPDYFNRCSYTKDFDIEDRSNPYVGFCKPRTGNACVGLLIIAPKFGEMEHIQSHLVKPLISQHKYKINFWVRLSYESSDYATYNIGAVLSKSKILYIRDRTSSNDLYTVSMVPEYTSSISNSVGEFITDTNWVNISGIYEAKGGEEYITIGIFWDDNPEIVKTWKAAHAKGGFGINAKGGFGKEYRHFRKALVKHALVKNRFIEKRFKNEAQQTTGKLTYYFIDDVSVSEIKRDTIGGDDTKDTLKKNAIKTDSVPVQTKQLTIETYKNIVLNNVFFGTNRSELLQASFNELNRLVDYLEKSAKMKITINGYTDNTGTPEKNLSLSQARAKAVAEYLISKGIDKSRVSYKGFGSANPIAPNDTEDGRTKNRRVEFKITNK